MNTRSAFTTGLCALVALGLAAAPAAAQEASQEAPEEALIEEQDETQVLTDDLIGMNIYSTNTEADTPEHIGAITSLLLNENDRLTGVVVSIGGFLGFGAKSVALNWEQIEVRQWDDTSYGGFIKLTRQELEEAPEFKTLAAIRAEEAAEREREQLEQQQQDAGTGTGTGTTQ